MSTVEYEICDRCGEKVNYHSRKLVRVNTVKFKWIICGSIIESERLLCKNCTQELEDFMSRKEKKTCKHGYKDSDDCPDCRH